MRRDAQQRRDALIQAAAECFSAAGYGVALEDIADRAGVGRGTLYRNFKDRMALILAIFDREVDRTRVDVDPALSLSDTMARLITEGAPATFLFARLATEMPLREGNLGPFLALATRLETLVDPVARIAQARGEIRADVGGREVVMAMRMVSGLLRPDMTEAERQTIIKEGLKLVIDGLS